jgi:uncharacterized protein YhhL (DUF1145 family)
MVSLSWPQILADSFNFLWTGFLAFMPNFLAALILFVLGLAIATIIGKALENIVDVFKIDALLEKMGARTFFDRAGIQLDSGRFLGELAKWFLVLAFLLAATDILNLDAVSLAIRSLLSYVPNVIVAVVIILAAVVLADFLQRVVLASAKGADLKAANLVGAVTKWSVFVFGLLAALSQLTIARDIINILLTGLVAMLALAGGLAFGLGGKEYAQNLLEKFRREIE